MINGKVYCSYSQCSWSRLKDAPHENAKCAGAGLQQQPKYAIVDDQWQSLLLWLSVLLILADCKSVVATLSKGWDEAVLLPRLQWWLYLISNAAHQHYRHGGKAPSDWLVNKYSSDGTSACYCSQSYSECHPEDIRLNYCTRAFLLIPLLWWARLDIFISVVRTGLIYLKRPFLSSWIKLRIQSQLVNLLILVNQSWHIDTR